MLAQTCMAEVVVIVNPANSSDAIKSENLKQIFLGKQEYFANGEPVQMVYQAPANPTRVAFDETFLGKTGTQMNAYWGRRMFSGDGVMPQELTSDLSVLDFVSKTPSGIGYIDKSAVNGSVKVLNVQ